MKKLLVFAFILLLGCAKETIEPTADKIFIIDGIEIDFTGGYVCKSTIQPDSTFEHYFKFDSYYQDEYIVVHIISDLSLNTHEILGTFPINNVKELNNAFRVYSNSGERRIHASKGFVKFEYRNGRKVIEIKGSNDVKEFYYFNRFGGN